MKNILTPMRKTAVSLSTHMFSAPIVQKVFQRNAALIFSLYIPGKNQKRTGNIIL